MVAAYLDTERPAAADTDRVFVVLKGHTRCRLLSVRGLDEVLAGAFEAICENCSFFQTSIEFRPTLQPQHDDAEGASAAGVLGNAAP